MNITDLDIRERTDTISVRGKGNKARTVPAPKELRRKLADYLSKRTDGHTALFPRTEVTESVSEMFRTFWPG